MGFPAYRAGWYAPYWLDRVLWGTKDRSADRIVPELQDLAVGDRVPDSLDGSAYFTVVRLEPAQLLVLHSTTHVLKPYTDLSFVWIFALRDQGDRTRLVIRARASYSPVWPAPLVKLFFSTVMALGDFWEAGAILGGVKRRAEGSPASSSVAPSPAPLDAA